MKFRFPRLFSRAQARPTPATVRLNDQFPPARPVRQIRPAPPTRTLRDYQPKPVDAVDWLLSLPREKRLRAERLLRHGYGIGRAAADPAVVWRFATGGGGDVVQLRMAA